MNCSMLQALSNVSDPCAGGPCVGGSCVALYSCLLALLLLPAAVGNLSLILTLWTRDPDLRDLRGLRDAPGHRTRGSGGSGWSGWSRGPCSSFTLSMSVSDLLLCLSVLPTAVFCSATAVQQVEHQGVWCQAGGFLLVLLLTSSLHARMWAAVGQFSEIRHALSNGRLWTSCRIRVLVLLLWIYSVANASLPVLGLGKYRYSAARALCGLSLLDEDAVSRAMSLWWLSVSVATPLMLTCALQGYVVHVARRQARRGTFRCNETHCFYVPAHVYEKSSNALLTSTGALLLTWTPFLSVSLYEGLSLDLVPVWVSQGSMLLVLSSCAVTPGVTCLTQPQYRAAARVIMSRLFQLFSRPNPAPPPDAANQISTTGTSLPGAVNAAS